MGEESDDIIMHDSSVQREGEIAVVGFRNGDGEFVVIGPAGNIPDGDPVIDKDLQGRAVGIHSAFGHKQRFRTGKASGIDDFHSSEYLPIIFF